MKKKIVITKQFVFFSIPQVGFLLHLFEVIFSVTIQEKIVSSFALHQPGDSQHRTELLLFFARLCCNKFWVKKF